MALGLPSINKKLSFVYNLYPLLVVLSCASGTTFRRDDHVPNPDRIRGSAVPLYWISDYLGSRLLEYIVGSRQVFVSDFCSVSAGAYDAWC